MLHKPYKKIGNLEIYGNNHNIPLLFLCEFSDMDQEKIKKEFDYLNAEEIEEDRFFSYKGWIYSLGDFMRVEPGSPFAGFDGHHGDSFFSGTLVKLDDTGESVKAYTYIA